MESQMTYAYIRELYQQCVFAQLAYEQMIAAIETFDETNQLVKQGYGLPGDFDLATSRVFLLTHAFLTHGVNITSLLMPEAEDERSAEAIRTRGTHLMSELQLTALHGLDNRELRDHLRHYDARVQEWVQTAPEDHHVFELTIDQLEDVPGNGRAALPAGKNRHRWLDPYSDPDHIWLIFEGDQYDLSSMLQDVNDIKVRTEEWLGTWPHVRVSTP